MGRRRLYGERIVRYGWAVVMMAFFCVSCAGQRFTFEVRGAPVRSRTESVRPHPSGERVPGASVTIRVEARAVTQWDIHGYEPDARLILGGLLSTVAGVVVTPVFYLKRLLTGWGEPGDEAMMRQWIHDRYVSHWLFMGYLWSPLDYEVVSRQPWLAGGAYPPPDIEGDRRESLWIPDSFPRDDAERSKNRDISDDTRVSKATGPVNDTGPSGPERETGHPPKRVSPAFDDDLPALLAAAPRAALDSSAWLFVVGIEAYDQSTAIAYSRRSAELFTRVAMKRFGIPVENVFLLTDDGKTEIDELKGRSFPATAASIQDQLRFLHREVGQGDRIYLYYSGHGLPSLVDGDAPYLLARDQAPDFVHMNGTFRLDAFYGALARSRAGEIVVFMESCFTGLHDGISVFGTGRAATRLVPRSAPFDEGRMVVITAGTRRQFSTMYPEKGHRLFSYFLMRELLKEHDTVGSLYRALFIQTRRMSRRRGGTHLQEPTIRGKAQIVLGG